VRLARRRAGSACRRRAARPAGIWGGTTETERDAALESLTARARTDDVLDCLLGSPPAHAGPQKRGAA
jgi:hypothetical protein